ncbi:type II secretion system F family protein [Haloarchaeobius amylolyticus]|uniref:type II secretion system F family protein n=1 Tax=Haloarchaeobius amylolyticus TaxID=1198296 RepID=UPI0026E532A7|nr:type II secretion system F family protein [Haloarchaeobius amylolyticus]
MPLGGERDALLDRLCYALFSRHADRRRHDADRTQYRATAIAVPFDLYVSRVYALSWLVGALCAAAGGWLTLAVSDREVRTLVDFLAAGAPVVAPGVVPSLPPLVTALGIGLAVGVAGKWATRRLGGRYLRWVAAARRTDIERTLPGAVRYLRALSTGSDDQRAMLRKVAANREAYGETAVAARTVLNKAALTGSLDAGLRLVARDTPSRDALAPFLLKFREHADQGAAELTSYLQMEARMLGHRQTRDRDRAEGFLELLAELFIVLLVLPALLVIVLTVMSVLTPGLNRPTPTPLGPVTPRTAIVYGSAVFVIVVGWCAASLVGRLRPPNGVPSYRRPAEVLSVLATATTNPASAAAVWALPALLFALVVFVLGEHPLSAGLLGYVAYAVPVGAVALRRAGVDDAKDREIKDFVHAISGHIALGRPFAEAVALVARDVDLGALDADVADLAFNANLTTRSGDLRAQALARFVEQVGTPLAEQTMGLVTGALDAGSDVETVFDTLQTEVGRLYHEKKALQSAMLVYVAVGWTVALLIVGIMIAVNTYVLDSFAQLSAVSAPGTGFSLDPDAVKVEREHFRFYVVTQATMLASGWFAGMANRGWYDALLHSGCLVLVAHVVFRGVGMV